MRLTRLDPHDERFLRTACRRFLQEHLRWWSDAYGLDWSDGAIDGHLAAHDLVERDVGRLFEASRRYESNFVAVARVGDVAVGAIWAESNVHPFLKTRIGVVAWIFVDPGARGGGIGGALVAAALDWMRSRGLPCAELMVVGANVPAVRMYERAGLRVVDWKMGRPL